MILGLNSRQFQDFCAAAWRFCFRESESYLHVSLPKAEPRPVTPIHNFVIADAKKAPQQVFRVDTRQTQDDDGLDDKRDCKDAKGIEVHIDETRTHGNGNAMQSLRRKHQSRTFRQAQDQ